MKNKLIFCVFIFSLFSCGSKNGYKTYFYHKGKAYISDVKFYSFKNGNYIYIDDENLKKEISSTIIDSIKFNINGKEYLSKPIKLFFSRDKPNSDFYYPILNKTKRIQFVSLDNKKMIGIFSLNTDIEKLKQSEKIDIKRIIDN